MTLTRWSTGASTFPRVKEPPARRGPRGVDARYPRPVRVVFLRHATAVPRGAPGFADAERPLMPDGEREARAAGLALRRLDVSPDAIVTSPFVRARETAVLAARALER